MKQIDELFIPNDLLRYSKFILVDLNSTNNVICRFVLFSLFTKCARIFFESSLNENIIWFSGYREQFRGYQSWHLINRLDSFLKLA